MAMLVVLWSLGACAEEAATSAGGGTFTGGWSSTRSGCEQRLVLEENGEFTLSARIALAGSTRLEQVSGRYTQADGEGAPRLRFVPDGEPGTDSVLYCDQWINRSELDLDFAEIDRRTGIEVGRLRLRREFSAALGGVTVGTDSAQADRYAAFLNSAGDIVEAVLTNPDPVPHPLYRSDFTDPNHDISIVEGHVAVNMPHGAWRGTFVSVTPNTSVSKLVLNVVSASELWISALAETGLPPCNYSIFSDPTFSVEVSRFTFAQDRQLHSISLNPADPEAQFYKPTITVNGASATAYMVPISINAPDSGDCAVSIRGRSLVLTVLEALQREGNAALVVLPVPGPGPRMAQFHASSPSTLFFDPLPAGLAPARSRLHSAIISLLPMSAEAGGSSPAHDVIDLLQLSDGEVAVAVEEEDGRSYLSLYPETGSATALGPLRALRDHDGAAGLSVPSTNSLQFSPEEGVQFYRFELNAADRVAIWTEGGRALAGELYTASGRDLGRNKRGAPDGAGFQMVRALPAGAYVLAVYRLQAAGSYVLRLDRAAGFPFADDALGECLIEAGWASGESITGLNCTGRGVSALAGLETVTGLRRLALGRNDLTDVSALQTLSALREVSLDDNRVADLSPLAGLTGLERLGLARNPLATNALTVLGGLASLTHLDLRGVPTLTSAQARSLKQTRADTLIVAPDGSVLQ